jgi:hypothetical protein
MGSAYNLEPAEDEFDFEVWVVKPQVLLDFFEDFEFIRKRDRLSVIIEN